MESMEGLESGVALQAANVEEFVDTSLDTGKMEGMEGEGEVALEALGTEEDVDGSVNLISPLEEYDVKEVIDSSLNLRQVEGMEGEVVALKVFPRSSASMLKPNGDVRMSSFRSDAVKLVQLEPTSNESEQQIVFESWMRNSITTGYDKLSAYFDLPKNSVVEQDVPVNYYGEYSLTFTIPC